jgi:hypothetical protein
VASKVVTNRQKTHFSGYLLALRDFHFVTKSVFQNSILFPEVIFSCGGRHFRKYKPVTAFDPLKPKLV